MDRGKRDKIVTLIETVQEMAQAKCKHGFGEQDFFKKIAIKYVCTIVANKYFVTIRTLSLSVVCHAATTL